MTNFSKRFERPIEFLQQRLSSESTPGLHLDFCWFGVIAEDLSPFTRLCVSVIVVATLKSLGLKYPKIGDEQLAELQKAKEELLNEK